MPIFPIECKPGDRNLDGIRRDNYEKSKDNIYPSHYLLPNCEQPEILKMFKERTGKVIKKTSNKGEVGRNIQNTRTVTRTKGQVRSSQDAQAAGYNRTATYTNQKGTVGGNQRNDGGNSSFY